MFEDARYSGQISIIPVNLNTGDFGGGSLTKAKFKVTNRRVGHNILPRRYIKKYMLEFPTSQRKIRQQTVQRLSVHDVPVSMSSLSRFPPKKNDGEISHARCHQFEFREASKGGSILPMSSPKRLT